MRDTLFIVILTVALAVFGALSGRWLAHTFEQTGGGRQNAALADAARAAQPGSAEAGALQGELDQRRHFYAYMGSWMFGGLGLVISITAVGIRSNGLRPSDTPVALAAPQIHTLVVTPTTVHSA